MDAAITSGRLYPSYNSIEQKFFITQLEIFITHFATAPQKAPSGAPRSARKNIPILSRKRYSRRASKQSHTRTPF